MSEINTIGARFLHGTLQITILDAITHHASVVCMCLRSDNGAYVSIDVGGIRAAETTREHDRVWNQTFLIHCAYRADVIITMELRTRHSVLGTVSIPGTELLGSRRGGGAVIVDESFFGFRAKTVKTSKDRKLRFRMRFVDAETESVRWSWGLDHGGVRFPWRSNCDVVLYQDAHHRGELGMPGSGRPPRLWEDIYKAIEGSKHLVCIVGWSLNPKLVLIRDPDTEIQHGIGVTIGDLLKRKAEEGVAVRLLLWNDETSLPLIRNQGLMRTHGQEAMAFFRNSKVICRLCLRSINEFPSFFSHHQKTITVDSAHAIVSFVGGLDLCDGRYDTKEHSLFRTLNTAAHDEDFYQVNIAGASLRHGGPREPWHDVHAQVSGAAAVDILTNFEQRWIRQCDPSLLPRYPNLVSLSSSNWNWNVQVFRSIDSSSAQLQNGEFLERSIQDAYVEAIRKAERFIYIENQYFMGSSHLWEKDQHCGCANLIPAEIALKVASKVRSRQPFAVYIVIPMWPEGYPESEVVQEMLHWTRLTMCMMYKLIAEAISESCLDCHPKDYLNFFCLANRETETSGEFLPPSPPGPRGDYGQAQKNRRFMVYVHSKLMIVDDEYAVVGSANVNQRSMDGRRDSEIAIGCWQEGDGCCGVKDYRLGLWGEHMGGVDEVFGRPEGLECVMRVREIGDETWRVYSGEEVVDMGGVHLVSYPVEVGKDGSVGEVEGGGGVFPDTNAAVRGRKSLVIPPMLST